MPQTDHVAVIAGHDPALPLANHALRSLDGARAVERPRIFLESARWTEDDVYEAVAALSGGLAWVWLAGEFLVHRGKPAIRLGGARPLRLEELFEALPKGDLVLVVDATGDAGAVSWPEASLRIVGSGITERLAKALVEAGGEVTAGALARAFDGHAGAPELVLGVAGAGPEALAREAEAEAWFRATLGDHDLLPWQRFEADGTGETPEPPRLADIYVDGGASGDKAAQTVDDAFEGARALLLVGDPGAGKTTFVRKLTCQACRAGLSAGEAPPGLSPGVVPLHVVLADYAAKHPSPCASSLLKWALSEEAQGTAGTAVPRRGWEEERALLLLDGLDEVTDPKRRKRVADAAARIVRQNDWLKVVLTTRPAALDEKKVASALVPPFARRKLLPFDDERRAKFVGKWMAWRHQKRGEAHAQAEARRLLDDLRRHPRLHEDCTNPLLLTLICGKYHADGQLPSDRVDLYREIVRGLCKDLTHSTEWEGPSSGWTLGERRNAAIAVAWRWWKLEVIEGGGEGTTFNLTAAAEAVAAAVKCELEVARDAVRWLELRTALVRRVGYDLGEVPLLAFGHRTYGEYLVALRLYRDACSKPTQPCPTIRELGADATWREVARLWADMFFSDEHELPGRDAFGATVRTLVGDAGSRPARGRLAAQLIEGRRERVGDLAIEVDGLQPRYQDADFEVAPADRVGFWRAVGLADTRYVPKNRWVPLDACEAWFGAIEGDIDERDNETARGPVQVGALWACRWPVTVDEFRDFVKDGGYRNADWWSGTPGDARAHGSPGRWAAQAEQPTAPVTDVSWWAARAYCAWLTETRRGLPEEVGVVRLPREHEWERLARGPLDGPTGRAIFPWGKEPPDGRANFRGQHGGVTPVGAFPSGHQPVTELWDLAGNVWEWTADVYTDELPDPAAEVGKGERARRALRGGGWDFGPHRLRVSYRFAVEPARRIDFIGFRCVASPRAH